MPRIARRYRIQCSLQNTHTLHIELDGGRQGGRQRRSEEGWEGGSKGVGGRMGTREHGEGREGREVGR